MTDLELDEFCSHTLDLEIDAVITGNTTKEREPVKTHLYARETGGLSGAPLKALADERLQAVSERLGDKVTLIGVGGITCASDAQTKIDAGAQLVQLYSGLIYHGPALVQECVKHTNAYR